MERSEYLKLKEAIRVTDKGNNPKTYDRHKELLARAEAECSPQQNAAINRMLAEREGDWMDREAGGW